jgi:hypothetical protein
MTKLDMRGVREERFEGLVYHQGAIIGEKDRRVEASNSCARTLIFGSFLLLPFVKFFSLPLFRFFDLAFYCLFSFFDLIFLSPFVFSFFSLLFCPCFFSHVVSSITYLNLLGNKRLLLLVHLSSGGCRSPSELTACKFMVVLFFMCSVRSRTVSVFFAQPVYMGL